ncbi:hypothetical protein DPV78_010365 [Talaromyces pinophilus]|nr:hypothetical protein DPV78_010365 [Talaromyces pinophilus]
MWLFIQRLLFLVLGFTACLSQAQIFTFDVPADQGLCSDAQQTKIGKFISDAKTLVADALWAIDQRNTHDPALLALFTSYFGIRWTADYSRFGDTQSALAWETVHETLKAVKAFLDGNGLPAELQFTGQPPFAFCGDATYQTRGWGDMAVDYQGDQIEKDDGTYETIWDLYKIDFPDQSFNPFYSPVQKGYAFTQGSRPCADTVDLDGNPAQTMAFVAKPLFPKTTGIIEAFGKLDPSMVLCDVAIDKPAEGDNMVEFLSDIQYPTASSPIGLDDQLPQSSIFFHELTHLTTTDVTDRWYPLNSCIKNAVTDNGIETSGAETNAQSYMLFAMAIWYYRHPPAGVTPATFYQGRSNDKLHIDN